MFSPFPVFSRVAHNKGFQSIRAEILLPTVLKYVEILNFALFSP